MFKKFFKQDKHAEIMAPSVEIVLSQSQTDNLELIAAISACLALSMNVAVDSLVVRSIKKVPLWNTQNRLQA